MYDNQKTLIRMFLIQMSLVLHDMIFYAVLSVVKEAVFIKTSECQFPCLFLVVLMLNQLVFVLSN